MSEAIAIPPRDPRVTDRREAQRLSTQCVKMIRLLQSRARVPNRELARMALKYTSRISDLRDAGYLVVCTPDPVEDGLTWYSLRDPRWEPSKGYHVHAQGESRTVCAVRRDDRGRRWVIYKTPARLGVTRVLLSSWRAWATAIPTSGKRGSPQLWKARELIASRHPAPRPRRID